MTQPAYIHAAIDPWLDDLDHQPSADLRRILLELAELAEAPEQTNDSAVAFALIATATRVVPEVFNNPTPEDIAEGIEIRQRVLDLEAEAQRREA